MSSISSFSPVTTREQASTFLEAQGGQMLAPELIIAFMCKMDLSSVSTFSLTCKYINALSKEDYLWEHLISEHFWMNPAHEITPNNRSYLEAYQKLKIFHSNLSSGVYSKRVLLGHRGLVGSLITDKNRLFSGSYDHTIKIWDETGKCIDTLEGHQGDVTNLLVIGNKLFSGSADKTIKVWEIETGKCLHTFEGHEDHVISLAVFNDKLYSSSLDATLRVWNLETNECINIFRGINSQFNNLAADNNVLYWNSDDFKIKGWDVDSKECFSTFEEHNSAITVLHSAENKLASCSVSGEIKVWDKKTGLCTNTFQSKGSQIEFLNILGNELIAIALDNTMNVWNLETEQLICKFQNPLPWTYSSAIAGSKVYLGHGSDTISILDFSAPDHVIFEEIVAQFRSVNSEQVVIAKTRFLRMPEKARNEIYGELYEILKPFTNDYFGCGEHAFRHQQGLASSAEQKAQAIENYLKK